VREDGRAGPADILRHADAGVRDLRLGALAAQLLRHLNDLIHARRADRMATRLESAARGDRDAAFRGDLAI